MVEVAVMWAVELLAAAGWVAVQAWRWRHVRRLARKVLVVAPMSTQMPTPLVALAGLPQMPVLPTVGGVPAGRGPDAAAEDPES